MKQAIKYILAKLGLLDVGIGITDQYYRRKLKKEKVQHFKETYGDRNSWNLESEDLHVKYDTSDWYSKKWFYPRYDHGKIHEPVATRIFQEYVNQSDDVLDIGGHLGYFSCIAGKLAPKGRVHVFEVDPKCTSLIQQNAAINDLSNVSVHNKAVSDQSEVVRIPKHENPNPGLMINSKINKEYISVDSILIDDFVEANDLQPKFIKIDVEGAEGKVLRGMTKTLQQKDLNMLVEIHVDRLQEFFHTDYKDIIRLLLNNGFKLFNIEHRLEDSTFKEVDATSTLEGNTMLLCCK